MQRVVRAGKPTHTPTGLAVPLRRHCFRTGLGQLRSEGASGDARCCHQQNLRWDDMIAGLCSSLLLTFAYIEMYIYLPRRGGGQCSKISSNPKWVIGLNPVLFVRCGGFSAALDRVIFCIFTT